MIRVKVSKLLKKLVYYQQPRKWQILSKKGQDKLSKEMCLAEISLLILLIINRSQQDGNHETLNLKRIWMQELNLCRATQFLISATLLK